MSLANWLNSWRGRKPGYAKAPANSGKQRHQARPGLELLETRDLLSGTFGLAETFGGGQADSGRAVATDAAGNVYIAGTFRGTVDFDPSGSTANLISKGGNDVFVAKYTSLGVLVWAKSFGNAANDLVNDLAVDSSGNVYATGCFSGTVDFDPDAGQTKLTSAGKADIFVVKLDDTGALTWARRMGGNGNDCGTGIAVDPDGNVLTTGYFQVRADFNPGTAAFKLASAADRDMFVSKLDSSGNFVWAKRVGGFDRDVVVGKDIAVDDEHVYLTGWFTGNVDFDPGAGKSAFKTNTNSSAFVLKLNSAGGFEWVKKIGGNGVDQGTGVAVDDDGKVYATGFFERSMTFGGTSLTSAGGSDVFVTRLSVDGSVDWIKQLGGAGNDQSRGIALDAAKNVYTTGFFKQTGDFNPASATSNLNSAGGKDIFISRLDTNGTFSLAKRVGDTGNDVARGIAINPGGNAFFTGDFTGTVDFDPDAGTTTLLSNGHTDVFMLKLKNDRPVAADDVSTTNEDTAVTINVTTNDTDADDTVAVTSVKIVDQPAHGTATVNATTGQITYTPNADFNGTDTFTYTIKDAAGAESAPATVTVTVNPINDPPRTVNDLALTTSGSPTGTPVDIDVLANDTDVDGTIDPTTVVVTVPPAHGTISVNPTTGVITYTPNDGFEGTDTFQYTVKDNTGATSAAGTVRVDVLPP